MAQCALGVVQAGFNGAHGDRGDAGDVFEGKIFKNVEQERRALGEGEFFDEEEEGGGVFLSDELGARIGLIMVRPIAGDRVVRRGGEDRVGATGAAPVLHAFLVGDAEEPGGKTGVIAERGDVADGGGEGFLDDVEGGGVVAEHFGDISVER